MRIIQPQYSTKTGSITVENLSLLFNSIVLKFHGFHALQCVRLFKYQSTLNILLSRSAFEYSILEVYASEG